MTVTTGPTTSFERVDVSADTAAHIPAGYKLHSRLFNGQHLFTVTPIGREPGNDPVPGGGYPSIAEALRNAGIPGPDPHSIKCSHGKGLNCRICYDQTYGLDFRKVTR